MKSSIYVHLYQFSTSFPRSERKWNMWLFSSFLACCLPLFTWSSKWRSKFLITFTKQPLCNCTELHSSSIMALVYLLAWEVVVLMKPVCARSFYLNKLFFVYRMVTDNIKSFLDPFLFIVSLTSSCVYLICYFLKFIPMIWTFQCLFISLYVFFRPYHLQYIIQ